MTAARAAAGAAVLAALPLAAAAQTATASATSPPASAQAQPEDIPFQMMDPGLFHTVPLKWGVGSAPLCAVVRSWPDWRTLVRVPAGGKNDKTGAPTSDLWNMHAVLVVGRLAGADAATGFHVDAIHRDGKTIEVDYTWTPTTSPGTKWYAAIEIPKPLAPKVTFVEDGHTVCTVQPMSGHWYSPGFQTPAPAQPQVASHEQSVPDTTGPIPYSSIAPAPLPSAPSGYYSPPPPAMPPATPNAAPVPWGGGGSPIY